MKNSVWKKVIAIAAIVLGIAVIGTAIYFLMGASEGLAKLNDPGNQVLIMLHGHDPAYMRALMNWIRGGSLAGFPVGVAGVVFGIWLLVRHRPQSKAEGNT